MLQSKAILKKTSAFSKVSTCYSCFLHFQVTLPMKWTPQVGVQGNVYLGRNEKSGVDPPPSPTTPTSYRQLFCNLSRVHPCGLMHLLVHMRFVGRMLTKICRTTMLNFYKNYKKKLSVRGGCGGGRWRIDLQFFSSLPRLTFFSVSSSSSSTPNVFRPFQGWHCFSVSSSSSSTPNVFRPFQGWHCFRSLPWDGHFSWQL